jgi:hypothetical protein
MRYIVWACIAATALGMLQLVVHPVTRSAAAAAAEPRPVEDFGRIVVVGHRTPE